MKNLQKINKFTFRKVDLIASYHKQNLVDYEIYGHKTFHNLKLHIYTTQYSIYLVSTCLILYVFSSIF